ncbi:hypothetical protein, partial [Escherichia coli]|uniref:hypothetical protein n=1 Tax=Escherichia coli TaxID=562 RepID=UPI001BAE6585
WFVRGSDNAMTQFSAFATTRWLSGPERLVRYNAPAHSEILGADALGFSSAVGMTELCERGRGARAGGQMARGGGGLGGRSGGGGGAGGVGRGGGGGGGGV